MLLVESIAEIGRPAPLYEYETVLPLGYVNAEREPSRLYWEIMLLVTVLLPIMALFSVEIRPILSWFQEVAPEPSHIEVRRPVGYESVKEGGVVVQPVNVLPSYPYWTEGVLPSL
jgi:hypothetical protein